jgi:hypothetical protein
MNPATEPVGHAALAPEIGPLNALLRSELAAVTTYEQALARFADRPDWADLRSICHHHRTAAAVLRDQVTNLGGEPEAATVCDFAAPPAGTTITLEALRVEEERRLVEIERVLERDELPDECRFAIRTAVLPRCHEHIDALAGLAARARKG